MIILTPDLIDRLLDFIQCYDFVFKSRPYKSLDLFVSHPIADTTLKYLPHKTPETSTDIKNCILDLTIDSEREKYYTWIRKKYVGENFNTFFWRTINKPYRITILAMFIKMLKEDKIKLDKKLIGRMFVESYESVELPFQDKKGIKYMYNILKGVNLQDYAVKFAIPSTEIIIYRGQRANVKDFNISWTMSYSNASYFAKRWSSENEGKVYTARITRDDIWYISNNRNELEIVLKPTALKGLKDKIIAEEIV